MPRSMRSRRFSARCSTSRGSTPARCGRSSSASASTRCCASSKSNSRRWRARKGLDLRYRALLADHPLRPPPAAAAVAEPRLQRDQIHAQGPRAGRLPASRRQAAHRRVRHRARHSGVEEEGDLPRIPSARRGRQGGARIGPRPLDRAAHRTRARSQDRPALGAGPRLAFFGRSAAVERRAVDPGAARTRRRRPRAADRHHGAVHRQRAQGAGRHGRAARRLGLPGAESAGCRNRHRRDHRVAGRAQRPAGGLSPRPRQRPRCHHRAAPQVRRRPAGDPDHRRPFAARARRGA